MALDRFTNKEEILGYFLDAIFNQGVQIGILAATFRQSKMIFEKSQNEEDKNQLICTYNVEYDDNFMQGIPDTISLHRKKNTNTLYTINALNDLIRELNGGKLDKSYPIQWENYTNCLLLTNETGLNKIPTKIYTIIDVETWDKK